MDEQTSFIKDYQFLILVAKEEGEKNDPISNKFIHYVNEKPLSDLRAIDVVDRVFSIMEISKVFQKEEARRLHIISAKGCGHL